MLKPPVIDHEYAHSVEKNALFLYLRRLRSGTGFEPFIEKYFMVSGVSLKKVNRFLLCGILIVVVLYFAKQVLVPVTFAAFFAMLFTGLSNRMEKRRVPRILSTTISLLILASIAFVIGLLVYMQGKKLTQDLPVIEKKSEQFFKQAEEYVSSKLDIPRAKQDSLINKQMKSASDSAGSMAKSVIGSVSGTLGSMLMVIIFTFLFLYQREKYETFFVSLCRNTPPDEAKALIHNISKVAQNYLTGRALSVLIFTVLFTTGFLIIGLENAFLLAFIAALLTIVPYIGSIVGGLFPFAVALVTQDDTSVAVGALVVIVIIQGIDNWFIEPYVIGGEVNISGFFTILILLVGGLIWGIAGVVLFLPLLGVAKIIFDAIPELQPYGYLIGDQAQEKQSTRLLKKLKGLFGKKNG